MTQRRATPGWLAYALLFALVALQGCAENYSDELNREKQAAKTSISQLGAKIDGGELANALLIANYADTLAQSKPPLKEVAELLKKDSTSSGPLYQGLKDRLTAIVIPPKSDERVLLTLGEELHALKAASDPIIFNDSLIDVVNTLADLSERELPRIAIPATALTANLKGGAVPGSYLVGNPNYGRWERDSRGGSFWSFYGQYRLFSDLVFGRSYYRGPIGYNDWYGGGARYSYYGDYGRGTYGSARDRTEHRSRRKAMRSKGIKPSAPAKQYGSAAGRARSSNYSTARTSRAQSISKRQSGLFGSSARGARAGGK